MNSNLTEVLKELDLKRDRAIFEQRNRINKVYEKIPRIKEIDLEISKTGVLIAKTLLKNPNSIDSSMKEINSQMNKLKKEKYYLLSESNISIDFLEIEYDCDKCSDTGFLKNGEKCPCLKQSLIRIGYTMSNIENKLSTENFNTFNINIFSNDPFENEETSPRENILEILNIAEGFCINFGKSTNDNLLFYGTTGLGKSFLCNCIAKKLIDKGKVVIYQTAFKIMEIVENHRFNKNSNFEFSRENYNMLFEADLLIVDDLGTELSNSFTNTEFFNIINSRLLSDKKTIISTNLNPSEISNIYTDRFFSRIISNFKVLKFYGPDLRWESFSIK